MSCGQSDSKVTNKTEFMRYLNEHPDEAPALKKRANEYAVIFVRGDKFGDWLRQRHLPCFLKAYHSWWMKHPELFGKVYQQQKWSPI